MSHSLSLKHVNTLLLSGPRGKTYAFKGDYVWTVTDSGPGPLFRVSALWEGLPGNLDAAVYSPRTGWIHFFKGKCGTFRSYLRSWSSKGCEWEEALRSFQEGDRGTRSLYLMTTTCSSFGHSQETRCGDTWASGCLLAFP